MEACWGNMKVEWGEMEAGQRRVGGYWAEERWKQDELIRRQGLGTMEAGLRENGHRAEAKQRHTKKGWKQD
jgi:hypothetical protein